VNYRIVATLGPATSEERMWRRLVEAGVTVFRLNTAHFALGTLKTWLERIAAFLEKADLTSFPVILDLQGSKWRIGAVTPIRLEPGTEVELVLSASEDWEPDARTAGAGALPVPHPDFFEAADSAGGGEIALNDARVMLRFENPGRERITARVVRGGDISAGKGITLVGGEYRKEALSRKDRRVVELAGSYPSVRYALSYVKDGAEMGNYRKLFEPSTYLIAKVERDSALAEAPEVAGSADELWICRGDLGAEIGPRETAEKLFRFFPRIPEIRKPVFLAGQVLEHMADHPTPTRSEVSYLYESLQRGFSGFVLSDETAVGAYPLEACRVAALFRPTRSSDCPGSPDS
jgi:pyruvate kinase